MEAELKKYDKIHLGAGRQHLSGYLNVDIVDTPETDFVWDLSVRPWPFPSNRYDTIVMNQVLEHLPDVISTMEEIHRISTNAAKVIITVPYFSSVNAFRDPTHKTFFTYYSLDYFDDASPYSYYTNARFKIIKRHLYFSQSRLRIFFLPMEIFANLLPRLYERIFCYMIPASSIYFELGVIKP